jgi:hypothetical protein
MVRRRVVNFLERLGLWYDWFSHCSPFSLQTLVIFVCVFRAYDFYVFLGLNGVVVLSVRFIHIEFNGPKLFL